MHGGWDGASLSRGLEVLLPLLLKEEFAALSSLQRAT